MMAAAPFNIATHNGIITIRNPKTGQHRTVKIVTSTPDGSTYDKKVRWARELQDSNFWRSFAVVNQDGIAMPFRKFGRDSYYGKLCNILNHPERFEGLIEFMFEGRCRKCNRRLTNPESIESGLGPECRKLKQRK